MANNAKDDDVKEPPTLDPVSEGEEEGDQSIHSEPKYDSYQQWLMKISKPKTYEFDELSLPRTRWNGGVMTDEDWERFEEWVKDAAKPIKQPDPPPPPEREKVPLKNLEAGINKLSIPKRIVPRFVPKKEVFTFVPAIKFGKPPRKEKKRKPFKYKLKKCIPIDELFYEFWRFVVKFETSESALKYIASPNIIQLSKPKKYPPDPHCPLPPKEKIPARIKMSGMTWIRHLKRLYVLSTPVERPEPIEVIPYRGRKILLSQLDMDNGLLYQNKKRRPEFYREPGKVKKSALTAVASARTTELAKPTSIKKKYKPTKPGSGVKKSALSYTASERIKEIAMPKTLPEPQDLFKQSRTKSKKEKFDYKCTLVAM